MCHQLKNLKKDHVVKLDNFPATKYPIIAAKVPATNWAGTISTFGYFLTIIINTAKEIGIINATIFPKNCSLVLNR